MTMFNRRNVWFVVIVALAAMLSMRITASAASPASHSSAPTTVHFGVALASEHPSSWTETPIDQAKAGQSAQAVFKLLGANGKRVGTVYWSVSTVSNGTAMATGEMRIFNRGRVELQGVWPWSNSASSGGAIIGGTGVFRGVHGEGYYTDATGQVTLTYR